MLRLAPGSAVPTSTTFAADVVSPASLAASAAATRSVACVGLAVSSTKSIFTGAERFPLPSSETTQTAWAPSVNVPPANWSSAAREIVNVPSSAGATWMSSYAGVSPTGSSAARSFVPIAEPTRSIVFVILSACESPESVARASDVITGGWYSEP